MERLIDTIVGFVREVVFPSYQGECRFDSIATQISGTRKLTGTSVEHSMETNRTDFAAGFALLGVNPNPAIHYPGAITYARQFKKCSILTEVNVSYSSNTSAITLKKVDNK